MIRNQARTRVNCWLRTSIVPRQCHGRGFIGVTLTHLFYDYLTSYEAERELNHLPITVEANRQYPNDCGYGTGMEDCMI